MPTSAAHDTASSASSAAHVDELVGGMSDDLRLPRCHELHGAVVLRDGRGRAGRDSVFQHPAHGHLEDRPGSASSNRRSKVGRGVEESPQGVAASPRVTLSFVQNQISLQPVVSPSAAPSADVGGETRAERIAERGLGGGLEADADNVGGADQTNSGPRDSVPGWRHRRWLGSHPWARRSHTRCRSATSRRASLQGVEHGTSGTEVDRITGVVLGSRSSGLQEVSIAASLVLSIVRSRSWLGLSLRWPASTRCCGLRWLRRTELLPRRRGWRNRPSTTVVAPWFGSPLVAAENSDGANPGVEVAIAGDRGRSPTGAGCRGSPRRRNTTICSGDSSRSLRRRAWDRHRGWGVTRSAVARRVRRRRGRERCIRGDVILDCLDRLDAQLDRSESARRRSAGEGRTSSGTRRPLAASTIELVARW